MPENNSELLRIDLFLNKKGRGLNHGLLGQRPIGLKFTHDVDIPAKAVIILRSEIFFLDTAPCNAGANFGIVIDVTVDTRKAAFASDCAIANIQDPAFEDSIPKMGGVIVKTDNAKLSFRLCEVETIAAARNRSGAVSIFPAKGPPLRNIIAGCLLYTSPSPRDKRQSRMPSSA